MLLERGNERHRWWCCRNVLLRLREWLLWSWRRYVLEICLASYSTTRSLARRDLETVRMLPFEWLWLVRRPSTRRQEDFNCWDLFVICLYFMFRLIMFCYRAWMGENGNPMCWRKRIHWGNFVFSYSDFSILLNFGVDSMIEYDKWHKRREKQFSEVK